MCDEIPMGAGMDGGNADAAGQQRGEEKRKRHCMALLHSAYFLGVLCAVGRWGLGGALVDTSWGVIFWGYGRGERRGEGGVIGEERGDGIHSRSAG